MLPTFWSTVVSVDSAGSDRERQAAIMPPSIASSENSTIQNFAEGKFQLCRELGCRCELGWVAGLSSTAGAGATCSGIRASGGGVGCAKSLTGALATRPAAGAVVGRVGTVAV